MRLMGARYGILGRSKRGSQCMQCSRENRVCPRRSRGQKMSRNRAKTERDASKNRRETGRDGTKIDIPICNIGEESIEIRVGKIKRRN